MAHAARCDRHEGGRGRVRGTTLARAALAAMLLAGTGCDHPEREPNDDFVQASAHPIRVGPGDWHGGVGTLPPGDEDWWRIDTRRTFGGGPDTVVFGIPPATAIDAHIYVLRPTGALLDRASRALFCPWYRITDPQKKKWCIASVAWPIADEGVAAAFVVMRNGSGSPLYGFAAD